MNSAVKGVLTKITEIKLVFVWSLQNKEKLIYQTVAAEDADVKDVLTKIQYGRITIETVFKTNSQVDIVITGIVDTKVMIKKY